MAAASRRRCCCARHTAQHTLTAGCPVLAFPTQPSTQPFHTPRHALHQPLIFLARACDPSSTPGGPDPARRTRPFVNPGRRTAGSYLRWSGVSSGRMTGTGSVSGTAGGVARVGDEGGRLQSCGGVVVAVTGGGCVLGCPGGCGLPGRAWGGYAARVCAAQQRMLDMTISMCSCAQTPIDVHVWVWCVGRTRCPSAALSLTHTHLRPHGPVPAPRPPLTGLGRAAAPATHPGV